jgi:hypothetical protein
VVIIPLTLFCFIIDGVILRNIMMRTAQCTHFCHDPMRLGGGVQHQNIRRQGCVSGDEIILWKGHIAEIRKEKVPPLT